MCIAYRAKWFRIQIKYGLILPVSNSTVLDPPLNTTLRSHDAGWSVASETIVKLYISGKCKQFSGSPLCDVNHLVTRYTHAYGLRNRRVRGRYAPISHICFGGIPLLQHKGLPYFVCECTLNACAPHILNTSYVTEQSSRKLYESASCKQDILFHNVLLNMLRYVDINFDISIYILNMLISIMK